MPHSITYNRPFAPTNPPQHLFDEGTGIAESLPRARSGDEAEAHPAPEPAPRQPGPDYKLKTDIGPNPAVHTGNPPPHPENAGSSPRAGDYS